MKLAVLLGMLAIAISAQASFHQPVRVVNGQNRCVTACKDHSAICLMPLIKRYCGSGLYSYYLKSVCAVSCETCTPCFERGSIYSNQREIASKEVQGRTAIVKQAQYLPCEDTISFCHRYFHNQKNCNEGHGQSIAKTQCRKFCGICDVEDMPCSNKCKDQHKQCSYWAKTRNYCEGGHSDWMKKHCTKSCTTCRLCRKGEKEPTTTTSKPTTPYRPSTTSRIVQSTTKTTILPVPIKLTQLYTTQKTKPQTQKTSPTTLYTTKRTTKQTPPHTTRYTRRSTTTRYSSTTTPFTTTTKRFVRTTTRYIPPTTRRTTTRYIPSTTRRTTTTTRYIPPTTRRTTTTTRYIPPTTRRTTTTTRYIPPTTRRTTTTTRYIPPTTRRTTTTTRYTPPTSRSTTKPVFTFPLTTQPSEGPSGCSANCKDGSCQAKTKQGSCTCDRTSSALERPRCSRSKCSVTCPKPNQVSGSWKLSCDGRVFCTCINRPHAPQKGAFCQ